MLVDATIRVRQALAAWRCW